MPLVTYCARLLLTDKQEGKKENICTTSTASDLSAALSSQPSRSPGTASPSDQSVMNVLASPFVVVVVITITSLALTLANQ